MHRIAIVGTGFIAGIHAQAINGLSSGRLVAVCSRDVERASVFGQRFGCAAYADLEAMLDRERPSVLCVATPSGAHLEPIESAARRGIHVIVEKPIEITGERLDRLERAAQRSGVRVGAIFQMRMEPMLVKLRAAMADGRFGRWPLIQATVPWWRSDAYYGSERWQGTLALDGGGALMNQAIHMVDQVLWLASATMDLPAGVNPAAEVCAWTGTFGHPPEAIEVEDTAVVNLRLRDGRVAQLWATTAMYPGVLRRLVVGGRDGYAEVLESQLMRWHFREAHEEDAVILERFGRPPSHGGGAGDPAAIDHVNHRANIAAILEDIDAGREPRLSGAVARQSVDVVLAAYASAKAGGGPVVL